MRKVISFSACLISGLFLSQCLSLIGQNLCDNISIVCNTLLYVCLGFIMINVGREFEVDKTRWRSYAQDYFIAMATAALPWIFIALYYVFVILPPEYWGSWDAWKENLLLSRFAAPTSAGILFTMLAAIGLKSSWIYKKIQVLAIFDDLDTILLMIPLQIMMIGLRWQLIIVIFIVFLLLYLGWKRMGKHNFPQTWKAIIFYATIIFGLTQGTHYLSQMIYGPDGGIHIEVLLPAFVLGMMIKHKENENVTERKVSSFISFLFMFLVGMSMPQFVGVDLQDTANTATSITGSQEMMSWGVILMHVFFVSLISNIGKLFPIFFYRDRKLTERLALSVAMFTRGEVGAGIIFIALGYNLGGPILVISVLTLAFNLIATGIFVLWVKKLALISYK